MASKRLLQAVKTRLDKPNPVANQRVIPDKLSKQGEVAQPTACYAMREISEVKHHD